MKKIIIVGAGISGLFFANLLKKNSDYEIIIYEKNNSINTDKGYGIQLSVNSIKLLNKIGFKDLDPINTFNPKKLDFYSFKDRKKICDLNISEFNTDEAKYTTLQRSILIEFLKAKLPEKFIQFNKIIKKIDDTKTALELTMEDNSTIECDYLIISDGVFSTTKSLISKKDIKNIFFNSIALRGTIDQSYLNNIDYPQIVRTFSDRCESTVNKMLEHINHTCKATEIWYNVYDNTQYQEPHTHGGAIFSLVYFNRLPEGSSKLQFTLNPDECSFHKERTAIFFVGGLEHFVVQGTNVDPRITWSSNYA